MEINNSMKFSTYRKTLPKSKQVYIMLFGKPTTHKEWAESFNKIGDINNVLLKNDDE